MQALVALTLRAFSNLQPLSDLISLSKIRVTRRILLRTFRPRLQEGVNPPPSRSTSPFEGMVGDGDKDGDGEEEEPQRLESRLSAQATIPQALPLEMEEEEEGAGQGAEAEAIGAITLIRTIAEHRPGGSKEGELVSVTTSLLGRSDRVWRADRYLAVLVWVQWRVFHKNTVLHFYLLVLLLLQSMYWLVLLANRWVSIFFRLVVDTEAQGRSCSLKAREEARSAEAEGGVMQSAKDRH